MENAEVIGEVVSADNTAAKIMKVFNYSYDQNVSKHVGEDIEMREEELTANASPDQNPMLLK
jgi:hypothetical protein